MIEQKTKIQVLLADDEAHIRKFMGRVLTSMGCQVVAEAENGDDAVELYRQYKPQITMLDINMPKSDGVSALTRIKAEFPGALVIMITSLSSMDVVSKCLVLGAANYIRKDTPIAEMKTLIKETWTDYQKEIQGGER